MQSGSAWGAAVMSYTESTRDSSRGIAIDLQCAIADDWNHHDSATMTAIIACLRSKSINDIQAASSRLPDHRMRWAPVADRIVLPADLETLAAIRPSIAVMAGDVHDEWLAWC